MDEETLEGVVFIGANNPETARMILALNKVNNTNYLGYIDNDPTKKGQEFMGLPVFGGFDYLRQFDKSKVRFINLITRDCKTRFKTSQYIANNGFIFVNFIHPNVELALVKIGLGNYIQESVILQAGVEIGNNSSIHMGSLIGHESIIGSSVFIAHGVVMSGCVKVKDGVFIGAGSVIIPRVSIGAWSIIGAGAVVTRDVPPLSVAVGNPAKVIKSIDNPLISGDPFGSKHE